MLEKLNEENFTQQLKTKFRVPIAEGRALELELDEVKSFAQPAHARNDVERFSLYFRGPDDFFLPQMTYRLEHERMGELDIFLVPVERDERGFRYEAVFSNFI